MEWWSRSRALLRAGLWVPAVALALVIVSGALQVRWLSQLSERERETRRAHLVADANHFGEDLDRELTRVYAIFQQMGTGIDRGDGRDAMSRYEIWRGQTPHPRLLRDVWFAVGEMPPNAATPSWRLVHLDMPSGSIVATRPPSALAALWRRLEPRAERATPPDEYSALLSAIDEDTLSMVVPILGPVPWPPPTHESGGPNVHSFEVTAGPASFAIVQLDREYLVGELLPALARRYFGTPAGSPDLDYQVAVVRKRPPHQVVYASHPVPDERLPTAPDATVAFLGIRSSMVGSGSVTLPTPTSLTEQVPGGPTTQVVSGVISSRDQPTQYWQLQVTHRAGSLEALARRTRTENILASATILLLLAGSLAVLVVALRRARALTQQQLEFVAGISHELRTPVAVIRVIGANLADGLISDAQHVQRYGHIIVREGRRLTEMTEQVLSFARIESTHAPAMQAAALGALIREALQTLQPQLDQEGFRCNLSVPDNLPLVHVDPPSVERAIQNLIGNALKYSLERREIRISAGLASNGARVWLAVEDHGMGIPADEHSLIFEPFRRGRGAVERNLPGIGLGLSLVRRIMQAHGGDVQVRSEPGAGSTFTLYFPIAPVAP